MEIIKQFMVFHFLDLNSGIISWAESAGRGLSKKKKKDQNLIYILGNGALDLILNQAASLFLISLVSCVRNFLTDMASLSK